MAVLIRGMEMPTRCGECPCAYSTEGAYWDTCQAVDDKNDIEQFWKSGRPDWCPLIEIPPHGDLIDRDAWCRQLDGELEMTKLLFDRVYPQLSEMCEEVIDGVKKDVYEMPTVIEAEGSGHE